MYKSVTVASLKRGGLFSGKMAHGNLGKRHKPDHPVFDYFLAHPELEDTVICMVKAQSNKKALNIDSSSDSDTDNNENSNGICGKTFKINSAGQKNSGTMTSNLIRHLGRMHPNEEQIVRHKAASVPPVKSRKV